MSSESTVPDPNKALESRKLKLEIKKLEIDLRPDRVDLERRKLVADLRDWYYRLAIAIISTIIGICTFFLGQALQRQSDEGKRQLEQIKDEDERFNHYMTALASKNAGERIAAAAPLQLYIEQADRYSAKDTGFEAKTARERSTLALVALATRLDSDDDPSALETYATVLANVGPISVSELARANRKSALRFAREAGDYAASRLGPPDAEAELRCESYEVQKGLLDDLHLIVIRSRMPFEGYEGLAAPDFVNPTFDVEMLLRSYGLKQQYQRECKLVLPLPENSKQSDSASKTTAGSEVADLAKSRDPIPSARNLVASSIALTYLLRTGKLNNNQSSLDGTFLVAGVVGDQNLSGLDFRNAYVAGSPSSFVCRDCKLDNADLRALDLAASSGKLDFTGSTTVGAHFRAPVPNTIVGDHSQLKRALQYCPDQPDEPVGHVLDAAVTCPKR